jgi:tetratricopeptide (TPR) repeat protein
VDAIVEGTVLRAGDRVRITAQLIDPVKEAHLWAESYQRPLRDVLDLQSEVAQAIARQVQVKLTPLEQAQFAQTHPVDPEAYESYLKGRYHWNRRSQDGLPKGVHYFQEAISKDQNFAAAYSGLADCFSGLTIYGFVAPDEGCAKAKESALRALELDPSLAEAHVSRGWVNTWYDFDFVAADREFERSIELNSRYAMAHGWFAFYLGLMGRYEEAYTECQRAIRLDPLSSVLQCYLACIYWMARRYDQAIEQLEKTMELDASFMWIHGWLGWAYLGKSMHQDAITAIEKGVQASPGSTLYLAALGEAYAAVGDQPKVQRILGQLKEVSKQRYVTPYMLARISTALGDKHEALNCLETAYEERAPFMAFLKIDPQLDNLRSDPRFQNLLRRMNFP